MKSLKIIIILLLFTQLENVPPFRAGSLTGFTPLLFGFIKDSIGVPMRDSIKLGTDLYYPQTSLPPWSTILQRTPYDRYWDSLSIFYLTDYLGYTLVVQNLRGTGDSEGEPMMFLTDGWGPLQDGYDAIEWLAQQPWSNGKIGMYGGSAHGITQYLAVGARPPHLICCVPMAAAPSLYHYSAYNGGEFRKALTETWLIGQGTPWLIDSVCNHPNYEEIWSYVDLTSRWDSASYPIFHITGWYDIFTDGQLDAFPELQARFHNQRLFIGPWGHSSWNSQYQGDLVYPSNAVVDEVEFFNMVFSWYNYWLLDSVPALEPMVTFYLMGDCDTQDTIYWNHWVEADTWPVTEVQYKNYYLKEGGILDTIAPSQSIGCDTFQYDPQNPCPTYGGREYIGLINGYGPINQNPIESRADVLVYTTPVLTSPLTVIGKLKFVLYAASNCYDTDWTIRVTDVYPDGRSILVTDNILMARHRHSLNIEDSLLPNVPDTFLIDLWSTAQVFNTGHRLRLILSSSNYPRFEKNPNTGAPFLRNDPITTIATQSVYRSVEMPSHLCLPVYPGLYGIAEVSKVSAPCENHHIFIPAVTRNPILHLNFSKVSDIELKIYNVLGQRVRSIKQVYARGNYEIALPHLSSGIYFIHLKINTKEYNNKIVVIK